MSKVKNITPEERENALALIRKLGLEETEQQINYYVKMQRDSKNHREEKEGQTKNDSSSSIGKIFGWGIIIALFLMIKMCGGCSGCEGCSSDSDIPEQKPTTFTRTCRSCGKTFETHHEDAMTCSTECYRAWERQKANFKKYGY